MNRAVAAPAAERASGVHGLGRADAPAEREADRFADSVDAPAGRFAGWSYGTVPVSVGSAESEGPTGTGVHVALPGVGRPLNPGLESSLGARLGTDLSRVRVHDDEHAADTAHRAGAEALAVGADIAFAPGRYDPQTPGGRRRIAHEVAHVAQPSGRRPVVRRDGAGAPVAPATSLTGLPEADRKRIQVVSTTKIEVTGIDPKFSTAGGTTTLGLPADTTVVLDPSIDPKLTHGIQNIAAALTTTADVTPAPMPDNSTSTLELDLTKYGGIKGLYRFTFHAPPAVGKAAPAKRILVEQLGAAAPPAGVAVPAAAAPGDTAPDAIADKMKKFGIVQSYSGVELDALRTAVLEVPDSHLGIVAGLRFARGTKHPTKPDVAGDYDPKTHTVTMFDRAFVSTQVTFQQGSRVTSPAVRAIVHEIGHAVDLDAIRKRSLDKTAADKDVTDLPKNFPNPDDPTGYRYDNPADKKKIADILTAQKHAEGNLLTSKSRSGTTTQKDASGDIADVVGATVRGIGYREAAKKDGIAVSKYGETDWQESYAEAYSLFITAPDTLKSLRPATFDYLDKNLPK